ncbi:unnamed protein product [Arabis nemorensis]|uniref:Uncharacterized protein n=1 Tax=Arabis nemorensis TaxID=586526 RepID=A0A565CG05_9BRAS|nr:unnamed protein product [Arabis nemorensis]
MDSSSDREFDELIKFKILLAKSGGFDVEHLMDIKPRSYSLHLYDDGDYSDQIILYAKFGIHRYNMVHGKNLQLSFVEKYNVHHRPFFSCYSITLVAKDLASGGSLVPFQTKFVEERYDMYKRLSCYIARPKFEPKQEEKSLNQESVDKEADFIIPEWPSENAFHDKSRYYLVKKLDLLNHDWIRLYMELAFLKKNTKIKKPKLSRLAIVKVAVETDENVERPNERLKARNATFYIKYKYRRNKGQASRVGKIKAAQALAGTGELLESYSNEY